VSALAIEPAILPPHCTACCAFWYCLPVPQVLCASNEAHDQVDPILPPEGVPVGERITFEG